MNRYKGLTVAVESKMITNLADLFVNNESSKKSYCIHTDVKELRSHMEENKRRNFLKKGFLKFKKECM